MGMEGRTAKRCGWREILHKEDYPDHEGSCLPTQRGRDLLYRQWGAKNVSKHVREIIALRL